MSDSASAALGTTQVQQNPTTAVAGMPATGTPTPPADGQKPQETAAPIIEAPKADPLAPKFAALTRKERDIQRREKELETKEAEIRESAKRKASENPLEALKEMGLSYDQITDYLLKQGKPDNERKLAKVEEEMENWKKEQQQREANAQRQREETAIASFKQDIKKFVSENAETFGLVSESQSHELVYSTIDAIYAKTGKLVPIEEATKLVEAHLEAEVDKIASYKKVQQRLAKKPSQETQVGEPAAKTETPTLTNDLGVKATIARATSHTEQSEFEAAVRMLKTAKQ